MQAALDPFLQGYNRQLPHQGRGMRGRTPHRSFLDGIPANDNHPKEKTATARADKVA